MSPYFSLPGVAIAVIIVAYVLRIAIVPGTYWLGLRRTRRVVTWMKAYRANMIMQGLGGALVLIALVTEPGLTARDLGLVLPYGGLDTLVWGMVAYILVVAAGGRWRSARRQAQG